jgi:hypothetical protein
LKLIIKKLSIVVYFLIMQERKTNLYVMARLPLSNVLSNTSCSKGTPSLQGDIALDELASREGACAWL